LHGLQRLLIFSDANLLLSIIKVTQSRTAGIDGVTVLTPAKRLKLFRELKSRPHGGVLNWDPFPVRRVYISRPDGRQRPIGIPTIKDRVVQGVIRCALEPEWESKFEASSYGYRSGRQINAVISRINSILMSNSKAWILEGDISKFFDCIDHSFLLSRLVHLPAYNLVKDWLKAGIFLESVYYETEEGTPPDIRGGYFPSSSKHLFARFATGVRYQIFDLLPGRPYIYRDVRKIAYTREYTRSACVGIVRPPPAGGRADNSDTSAT
jgi:RNA-directed DNA polymerase